MANNKIPYPLKSKIHIPHHNNLPTHFLPFRLIRNLRSILQFHHPVHPSHTLNLVAMIPILCLYATLLLYILF